MKIALINGSPKAKGSASEYILQTFKTLLVDVNEIVEFHFRTPMLEEKTLDQVSKCNVLVFAFPLYVDGIPSNLLNCLYQMEKYFESKPSKDITVYSLVNCGFYEGRQNEIALEIMKNWCNKMKFKWGQGFGIGGGGMLPQLTSIPDGKGPKKNFYLELKVFSRNVNSCTSAENIFISPNLPRIAYKLGAEMGWRNLAKSNGLSKKDLNKKK